LVELFNKKKKYTDYRIFKPERILIAQYTMIFYVVFLYKTAFVGHFEIIICSFSILQPKKNYKTAEKLLHHAIEISNIK
jgi:hypothetical protein